MSNVVNAEGEVRMYTIDRAFPAFCDGNLEFLVRVEEDAGLNNPPFRLFTDGHNHPISMQRQLGNARRTGCYQYDNLAADMQWVLEVADPSRRPLGQGNKWYIHSIRTVDISEDDFYRRAEPGEYVLMCVTTSPCQQYMIGALAPRDVVTLYDVPQILESRLATSPDILNAIDRYASGFSDRLKLHDDFDTSEEDMLMERARNFCDVIDGMGYNHPEFSNRYREDSTGKIRALFKAFQKNDRETFERLYRQFEATGLLPEELDLKRIGLLEELSRVESDMRGYTQISVPDAAPDEIPKKGLLTRLWQKLG